VQNRKSWALEKGQNDVSWILPRGRFMKKAIKKVLEFQIFILKRRRGELEQ
jgi:hypothetical protein